MENRYGNDSTDGVPQCKGILFPNRRRQVWDPSSAASNEVKPGCPGTTWARAHPCDKLAVAAIRGRWTSKDNSIETSS